MSVVSIGKWSHGHMVTSCGLTAWLWLCRTLGQAKALRKPLFWLGLAWPGSQPEARPCTSLDLIHPSLANSEDFPDNILAAAGGNANCSH